MSILKLTLHAVLLPLLLAVFILVTIFSPILLNRNWVETDKQLNRYTSFWETWRNNIKEIWTDDFF